MNGWAHVVPAGKKSDEQMQFSFQSLMAFHVELGKSKARLAKWDQEIDRTGIV